MCGEPCSIRHTNVCACDAILCGIGAACVLCVFYIARDMCVTKCSMRVRDARTVCMHCRRVYALWARVCIVGVCMHCGRVHELWVRVCVVVACMRCGCMHCGRVYALRVRVCIVGACMHCGCVLHCVACALCCVCIVVAVILPTAVALLSDSGS